MVLRETLSSGKVLDLGQRVIYDARWLFNGNLAHLLQSHIATLGFFKARLGIQPGECLVILENNAPDIARRLFALMGYETLETHRAVRATSVALLEQDMGNPFQLLPFASVIEPLTVGKQTQKRIFISRRSTRRISNEAEIADITAGFGYAKVYLEDLSLEDQFGLMRTAESIVAIHGAALGHLCMRSVDRGSPPVELVEVFSPGLVTDVFRKYVAATGGTWRGCRGTINSRYVRMVSESANSKSLAFEDFEVDPRALETCLSEKLNLTNLGI
jgi:Glycosyltransferase 61